VTAHASSAYQDFLNTKRRAEPSLGVPISPADVHPMLHDWQREIVVWAARQGRAAIWADTGLGKTLMQLEWARLSGQSSLIVAPLAVCRQTVREAARIGLDLRYVRSDSEPHTGMRITNYEMLPRLNLTDLDAIVLDESSILKQSDGKTRTMLIERCSRIPRRLSCTATPAPNDPEELTSQAEWLGVMSRVEMLAAYFVHDSDAGWRLKGHASEAMYRWMSTWATAIRRPSDMGYDNDGYILPGLNIVPHLLPVNIEHDGQLFPTDLGGVGGRARVRKQTLAARVMHTADLVSSEPDEPWLIWCGLNAEAEALAKRIPGAVDVRGSWTPEAKADAFIGFADRQIRVLITKPSMAGFGLNWQHCARMAFVGLGDSYESYYQSIRRCYRYGQTRVVDTHIVLSELEAQIAWNVRRKEQEAAGISGRLVAAMNRQRESIT
jgi:hypothetical protein